MATERTGPGGWMLCFLFFNFFKKFVRALKCCAFCASSSFTSYPLQIMSVNFNRTSVHMLRSAVFVSPRIKTNVLPRLHRLLALSPGTACVRPRRCVWDRQIFTANINLRRFDTSWKRAKVVYQGSPRQRERDARRLVTVAHRQKKNIKISKELLLAGICHLVHFLQSVIYHF